MEDANLSQLIAEAMETNKQANLALMQQLKGYGVRPDKPRRVDHNFLGVSEEEIKVLSEKLAQQGFECDWGECESECGDDWGLIASVNQSPENACSEDFLRKMVTLAVEHHCDYDGWGTEIDEERPEPAPGLFADLQEKKQAAFEKLKNNPAFDKDFLKQLEDL